MICLLFMAIALTGSASPPEAPPRTPQNRIEVDPNNISPQAARRLIEAFLLDPAGANGRAAMPLVLRFAAQSEAVDVQVVPEVVSWLGEGEDERLRILHGAFIAGNVAAQLDTGVNRHDPYSGLVAVFRVYRALRTQDPAFISAGVEVHLRRYRDGTLMQYLVELQEAPAD